MFDDGTNVYNNYNAGNKWRHVIPFDCYGVAMDRTTPMRQFGSCNNSYMERSEDFGANFNNSVPLYFIAGGVAAVQNTKTSNIWYQSGAEVRKNINNGSGSWVPISNFSNLSPAQFVAGVWTTPASGDYLFVSLTYYNNGNGNYHDLYITRNANDVNPQWSLLTQPINQNHWVHGIAGDFNDPEVFYISYDGCNSNEQVFKYDGHLNQWTNLSYNLRNLCMNEIAIEKGSDGGLYVGTDMGVYYTNNKKMQQYPNSAWIRYSTNLPRIEASRMIINYVTNNVYTGTFGRGLWRSGLACPDDYDLTLTGTHSDYFYEAQHDITSTASVNNNVKVKYRGGYAVEMNPGFIADAGSTFEAYIHPCDHGGNSFRQTNSEQSQSSFMPDLLRSILLYLNPTTGKIMIERNNRNQEEEENEESEKINVKVWDIVGRQVYTGEFLQRTLSIDLSNRNKGIYLVQLTNERGESEARKVVLQ